MKAGGFVGRHGFCREFRSRSARDWGNGGLGRPALRAERAVARSKPCNDPCVGRASASQQAAACGTTAREIPSSR
jgi:hypothetical protein